MSGFNITHYDIKADERFGAGFHKTVRLAVLSDLHNKCYGKNNRMLISAIEAQAPDLILCAGDLLTDGKHLEYKEALELMKQLAKRYTICYVNGNHESRAGLFEEKKKEEYLSYCTDLENCGIYFVNNSSFGCRVNGLPILVQGLELSQIYYKKGKRMSLSVQEMKQMIGAADREQFTILLAHHPLYTETYMEWGADLSLSGHLHGGIIRLPLLGGVISPQIRLFPKYDRGLFSFGSQYAIVSGGLGSHTIPIRINNKPELIVVSIHP